MSDPNDGDKTRRKLTADEVLFAASKKAEAGRDKNLPRDNTGHDHPKPTYAKPNLSKSPRGMPGLTPGGGSAYERFVMRAKEPTPPVAPQGREGEERAFKRYVPQDIRKRDEKGKELPFGANDLTKGFNDRSR